MQATQQPWAQERRKTNGLVDKSAAFTVCQLSAKTIYTYLSSHTQMTKWNNICMPHNVYISSPRTIKNKKQKYVVYRWVQWRKIIQDKYRNDSGERRSHREFGIWVET